MNKTKFIAQIKASSKADICDLVIKNITVVDVFQNSTFIDNVAIKDGVIVGFGDYDGTVIIDGSNKYICPSLMDAHCHIESSLVSPVEYSKAALLHGITSVVADPHEIANVLGEEGISLMLELSKNLPFDFYFMLPSCVPSTSFETSGAILESYNLRPFYDNKKVLGLAEVMNFPAVLNADEDMLNKIWDAKSRGLIIDGHCAGFTKDMLNVYATANVSTDHESISPDEVIERIRRGIYVHMREGSVAKNLKDLMIAANIKNSRRICLCTDDKHIDDLSLHGSIDSSIRTLINNGFDPETAISMATINSAECYKLDYNGAIAPGYVADFLILDDLKNFNIKSVYKNGELLVNDNTLLIDITNDFSYTNRNNINAPEITLEDLKIDLRGKTTLNAIGINPNKLESDHLKYDLGSLNYGDYFVSDTKNDLLKVAVIERHNNTGNIGLGIIKGLEISDGAIVTTVAHDSHNLIVCGTSDEDILFAIEEMRKLNGGTMVVKNKKVVASNKLEVGGLITLRDSDTVISELEVLHNSIYEVAPNINFNPFLTLSFLSLPVIPELKMTDKGLFNVIKFEFVDIAE